MSKRRKAKFKIGETAWCSQCKRADKITDVYWNKEMGCYFYAFGQESASKAGEGHTGFELRKIKQGASMSKKRKKVREVFTSIVQKDRLGDTYIHGFPLDTRKFKAEDRVKVTVERLDR